MRGDWKADGARGRLRVFMEEKVGFGGGGTEHRVLQERAQEK